VNVVRSIKWWRHEHADELPKYPKGYPLEHMIGHVLPDGIDSVPEGPGINDDGSGTATLLAQAEELADGHYNLGMTLTRLDRQQEALQAFARAIAQRPDFAAARWAFAMAQLPAVYEAEADPARCRTAFSLELANLCHWFASNSDHDSDAMALAPYTDRICYLHEDDWVTVSRDTATIYNNGKQFYLGLKYSL